MPESGNPSEPELRALSVTVEEAGKTRSLSLQATRIAADTDEPSALWKALDLAIARDPKQLGWAPDERLAEASPVQAFLPRGPKVELDLRVHRMRQNVSGFAVLDGDVVLRTVGRRVVRVRGTLHSRQKLEALARRLTEVPRATYDEGKAAVASLCDDALVSAPRREPSSVIDVRGERLLYVYACADMRIAYDAIRREDAESWSTRHQFERHPGGVDVLSVRDWDPAVDNLWFPADTGGDFTIARMQSFSNVLVDSQPREGSSVNCDYRMTYGGRPSQTPFPEIQDWDQNTVYVSGSCDRGGSAFQQTTTHFEYQVALHKLTSAARQAAWDSVFLFDTYEVPADPLAVHVHKSGGESCDVAGWFDSDLRAGWYDDGEICLDAMHGAYNRWLVPLHEYGHYLHEMFGMYAMFSSCDNGALYEGVANALALSLEHHRYGISARANDRITALFLAGPGLLPAATSSMANWVRADSACDGTPHNGNAVVQTIWSLLNNRVCRAAACDATNAEAIKVRRNGCGTVFFNDEMAEIARRALTQTIMMDPSDATEFLDEMRAYIEDHHRASFEQDEWERLKYVFIQH